MTIKPVLSPPGAPPMTWLQERVKALASRYELGMGLLPSDAAWLVYYRCYTVAP